MKQGLHGISVLVTRPKAAAAGLARLIRQQHGRPICQPGVRLQAIADGEPSVACLARLTGEDIVIFTSANAVRFALLRKPAAAWPAATALIAVGQRTADALVGEGLDAVTVPAAGANSEAVLTLPVLQQIAGRRVLIACAAGGRELLQRELGARGARVESVLLYRRDPPEVDRQAVHDIAAARGHLVTTVTSATILKNITTLIGSELLDQPLCTISERVARCAQELGYTRIQTAGAAGDQAMLEVVLKASRNLASGAVH